MIAVGRLAGGARFLDRMERWLREACRDLSVAMATSAVGLTLRQKTTLEIGSSAVLGMLAAGLQLGHWSPWSVPVALAGYYVWVIAYSEATVRATQRDRRPTS